MEQYLRRGWACVLIVGAIGCGGSKLVVEERTLTFPGVSADTTIRIGEDSPWYAPNYTPPMGKWVPDIAFPCDTVIIRSTAPPETVRVKIGDTNVEVVRKPYLKTIATLRDSLYGLRASYQLHLQREDQELRYLDSTKTTISGGPSLFEKVLITLVILAAVVLFARLYRAT